MENSTPSQWFCGWVQILPLCTICIQDDVNILTNHGKPQPSPSSLPQENAWFLTYLLQLHRYEKIWKQEIEKNTIWAFENSLLSGDSCNLYTNTRNVYERSKLTSFLKQVTNYIHYVHLLYVVAYIYGRGIRSKFTSLLLARWWLN